MVTCSNARLRLIRAADGVAVGDSRTHAATPGHARGHDAALQRRIATRPACQGSAAAKSAARLRLGSTGPRSTPGTGPDIRARRRARKCVRTAGTDTRSGADGATRSSSTAGRPPWRCQSRSTRCRPSSTPRCPRVAPGKTQSTEKMARTMPKALACDDDVTLDVGRVPAGQRLSLAVHRDHAEQADRRRLREYTPVRPEFRTPRSQK
jgi:hypothetical protein